MILTVEEAATRRCQESFGPYYVTQAGGETHYPTLHSVMSSGGGSGVFASAVSSQPALPTIASPGYCIGPKCMAWKWADKTDDGTFTGFCGKVGR
jgi:hypothetical protein